MATMLNFSPSQLLNPATDELELISLSQQGDAEAFASLYACYVERITRYVYFRVTDHQLAEDILPTLVGAEQMFSRWRRHQVEGVLEWVLRDDQRPKERHQDKEEQDGGADGHFAVDSDRAPDRCERSTTLCSLWRRETSVGQRWHGAQLAHG